MAVELIIYEWVWLGLLLLTLFGFYDRIFFLFSLLINSIVTISALSDGEIITQTVYNQQTSVWVIYVETTLSSTNVPSLPIMVFLIFAIIDALLFFTLTLRR